MILEERKQDGIIQVCLIFSTKKGAELTTPFPCIKPKPIM